MTRAEALQTAKPILFNTEMVSAILGGKKTVTRRLMKPYLEKNETVDIAEIDERCYAIFHIHIDSEKFGRVDGKRSYKPPYKIGDILYVRETWQYAYELDENEQIIEETGRYFYAADDFEPFAYWVNTDGSHRYEMPWQPSIHMPKEAARIFLRVTSVRVSRLQKVKYFDCINEGIPYRQYEDDIIEDFSHLWDSTIKKSDIDKYGWNANPWVWVIEFERIEVE